MRGLVAGECVQVCEQCVPNLDLSVRRGPFAIQHAATISCGRNLAATIRQRFGIEASTKWRE